MIKAFLLLLALCCSCRPVKRTEIVSRFFDQLDLERVNVHVQQPGNEDKFFCSAVYSCSLGQFSNVVLRIKLTPDNQRFFVWPMNIDKFPNIKQAQRSEQEASGYLYSRGLGSTDGRRAFIAAYYSSSQNLLFMTAAGEEEALKTALTGVWSQ